MPAEITTYCYYPGAQKDYSVANFLFRMGGAASLFSNAAAARRTARGTSTQRSLFPACAARFARALLAV